MKRPCIIFGNTGGVILETKSFCKDISAHPSPHEKKRTLAEANKVLFPKKYHQKCLSNIVLKWHWWGRALPDCKAKSHPLLFFAYPAIPSLPKVSNGKINLVFIYSLSRSIFFSTWTHLKNDFDYVVEDFILPVALQMMHYLLTPLILLH